MSRSTGPKTAQGKARASRNATKHGLLSVGWIDATEEAAYRRLLDALMADYSPEGAAEQLQVERIAINSIKLMRIIRVENAHFAKAASDVRRPILGSPPAGQELQAKLAAATPPIKVLDTFSRYQTSMERQISKATGELLAMQDRRLACQKEISKINIDKAERLAPSIELKI